MACILEENYCFDAEMYMDELKIGEEFRDDQRGKYYPSSNGILSMSLFHKYSLEYKVAR